MYLEVNYIDQLGSVCPFCGTQYNPAQKTKLDYFKNGNREGTFYWMGCNMCNMPSLIVSYLIQTPENNPGYSFQTHQYMFKQDYEEYFGVDVAEGAYPVPLYHEEDTVCFPMREVDVDQEILATEMEGLTHGKCELPYGYGYYHNQYTREDHWCKTYGPKSIDWAYSSPKGKGSVKKIS